MSGAFKVGKQRFADIKEKIHKRIIREKGLTYKQAMEEELLEWQKNEGSKGGMVAAIVEKDIQRELADVVSTETIVSTASKVNDSRDRPHAKQNMSTDNLVDENKTVQIFDPDRIGLPYFTDSGANSGAAKAAEAVGMVTAEAMKKIKEDQDRVEDTSVLDDQLTALMGGA